MYDAHYLSYYIVWNTRLPLYFSAPWSRHVLCDISRFLFDVREFSVYDGNMAGRR